MSVWSLQPKHVPEFWWLAEPLLDLALKPIGESANDFYAGALTGHYQLWLLLHGSDALGAMLTRVVVEESGRVLEVYALGGRGMKGWRGETKEALEEMKLHSGAGSIRFRTKRKASRLLTRSGFRSDDNVWWQR